MNKVVKIAVDAMGGDGSPKKVIDGIIHHYQNNKNTFYQIFGDKIKITNLIGNKLTNNSFEIIHTTEVITDIIACINSSTNIKLITNE